MRVCTHIIEKGENIKIKMSTNRENVNDSEEEEMVRRLGGRGRSLVEAFIRVRREKGGRAPQHLQVTQDNRIRPRQEVGPCAQEVGLGGLRARRRRNRVIDNGPRTNDIINNGQQSVPRETHDRPRSRVRARARPSTPCDTQASL